MSDTKTAERQGFASNFGFIMAAVGSAVGLGNIWKFPYITGEYGGGAFVLVYLVCIALVGLPLMYAELIIGKRGGKDVLGAIRELTKGEGPAATALTWLTGFMAVLSGFLILSFYSVVAGWAIHFLGTSVGAIGSAETAEATFGGLVGNPWVSSLWHTVFMALAVSVVAVGVHKGIERVCSTLMPILLVILMVLLVYVGVTGGLGDSLSFLFKPDFHKLTAAAVVEALGHSFFTLSLGMGAIVTYGSYLQSESHVVRDGLIIAFLDTFIALLAGTVIFAVVFDAGKEPGAGPGLLFVTLPTLFDAMPGGTIVASAFFLLVIFAAWSSAISLLEVVVAYVVDEWGWKRSIAAPVVGGGIWALGLASAFHGEVLDLLDNLTTRYMLPGGGLLIAILAGWFVAKEDRESGFAAFTRAETWGKVLAAGWTVLIRFVTPVLVLVVILAKVGALDALLKGE